MTDTDNSPKPKGPWDKIDIVLRPVGGLLTALSVALLGFICSSHLESWRATDANTRLYAELMSSREASDSALRQGMFNTIVSEFLNPDKSNNLGSDSDNTLAQLELSVLRLEVLAYNFHDSLDLSPLFKNVQRKLTQPNETENTLLDKEARTALLKRLEKVANEVVNKQLSALEEGNNIVRASFDFDDIETDFIQELIYSRLCYDSSPEASCKAFSVDVVSINRESKEVEVRMTIWNDQESGAEISPDPAVDVTFVVNSFDFPLVDNTRIGGSERCSLVLSHFSDYEVTLSLIYFPGSRASLKEKQFYDDILQEFQQRQTMAD